MYEYQITVLEGSMVKNNSAVRPSKCSR